MEDSYNGFTNEIYEIRKKGNRYYLYDVNGTSIGTGRVGTGNRKSAWENNNALRVFITKNGKRHFRKVPMDEFKLLASPIKTEAEVNISTAEDYTDIQKYIHEEGVKLKPKGLIISDLKWKYLIRSVLRAKNIMMLGNAGSGKTMAAKALIKGLQRPGFIFNLGSTQDPRATLIGNTQYSPDKGTFFGESAFVKAIRTPQAIILLDELSRAHPDAWNILMSVLDAGQRYLRLDEADGSPTVEVAEGVTFIATANVGTEYTSTRVIDRAIMDRFVTIEMDLLDEKQEFGLLKYMFPEVDEYNLKALAEIAHYTREDVKSEDSKLSSIISTRSSVEAASLLYDGFSLVESAEIALLPFFSQNGGVDSERTHIRQYLQKFIREEKETKLRDSKETSDEPATDTAVDDSTNVITW